MRVLTRLRQRRVHKTVHRTDVVKTNACLISVGVTEIPLNIILAARISKQLLRYDWHALTGWQVPGFACRGKNEGTIAC